MLFVVSTIVAAAKPTVSDVSTDLGRLDELISSKADIHIPADAVKALQKVGTDPWVITKAQADAMPACNPATDKCVYGTQCGSSSNGEAWFGPSEVVKTGKPCCDEINDEWGSLLQVRQAAAGDQDPWLKVGENCKNNWNCFSNICTDWVCQPPKTYTCKKAADSEQKPQPTCSTAVCDYAANQAKGDTWGHNDPKCSKFGCCMKDNCCEYC